MWPLNMEKGIELKWKRSHERLATKGNHEGSRQPSKEREGERQGFGHEKEMLKGGAKNCPFIQGLRGVGFSYLSKWPDVHFSSKVRIGLVAQLLKWAT